MTRLFDRLVSTGWLDRWRGTPGLLGRAIQRADVRWMRQMLYSIKPGPLV